MNRLLPWTSSLLRPEDDFFSSEEKSEIQLHRLLTLLGAVLLLGFGFLYAVQNPMGVNLLGIRLGIAAAFVALLVASYRVERFRRNYVSWVHGALYLLLGWTILLAYLNHFAGDYVTGLLLIYGALTVVMGIGVRSIRPVLQYLGTGFLGTALATLFIVAPYTSPLVLLTSMATIAIVEGLAIYAYLSIRRQLREREARLRGLTNSVPGVVFQFVAHPDGTWENTFISDRAETLLGISVRPSAFYERFLEHVPSSHREDLVDSITQAVNQQRLWRFEMPFERRDGTRLWLLGISSPDSRDDTLAFNGVIFDITDRKRAERGVMEREQKTEALYTATERLLAAESPEEVAHHLQDIIQSTFAPPLHCIRLEREGMLVPTVVSADTSAQASHQRPLAVDGDSRAAQAYRSGTSHGPTDRDGPADPSSERALPKAFVPLGEHGVMSLRSPETGAIDSFDIKLLEILGAYAAAVLDRIAREKALVEARDDAEAANQLKSRMLTNMDHEIRTPMTAIMGLAEILTDRCEGELAHLSEKIHQSSQRLMNTIESVLELSKLEAGTYELERERVDLNVVVAEVVDQYHSDATDQSVTLQSTLSDSPVQGLWNEDAVRRLVDNLLENAIKFTPADGTVTIRVRTTPGEALLAIEDTGIGMSQDALPEVFEAFKQESEGLCREYEGSGLGLAIVRGLVDLLEGDIRVDTKKGEGTRVRVRLPELRERRSLPSGELDLQHSADRLPSPTHGPH